MGFARITVALILLSINCSAQITTISTQNTLFGGSSGTTPSLNVTGANAIFVSVSYYTSFGSTISDNYGNTWNTITTQTNFNMSCRIYYCISCTVGSALQITSTCKYCGVNIYAASGVDNATPVDSYNGANQNASGSLSTGTLTPSNNNSVILTVFGSFNGALPVQPSGYTNIGNYATVTAEAGGNAYLIQTSKSSVNPTWSSTGSSEVAIGIVINASGVTPTPPVVDTSNFFFFVN